MELLLLVLLVLLLVGAFGGVGYRSGWWGGERADGAPARTPFFGLGANALGVIVLVLLVILVVSLLS